MNSPRTNTITTDTHSTGTARERGVDCRGLPVISDLRSNDARRAFAFRLAAIG